MTVWLAPGCQVHPGEALQLPGRLARGGRVGHVQLRHVGAGPGAGVGHGGGDRGRAALRSAALTFRLLNEKLVYDSP